jgi:dimethylhistidine N-methyltransferase
MPASLQVYDAPPTTQEFLADVLAGLHAPAKYLPCKYFYDAAGSELFERITQLGEYYLTRTELAIMRRHAPDMAALIGSRCLLIEYGSGSSTKTRLLLDRLEKPLGYMPVDISAEHLVGSAGAIASDYPHLAVSPVCADFTRLKTLPAIGVWPTRRLIYFPGSTIGNFEPIEAARLLRQAAALCGPAGGMILGADLKKDPRLLHAAYNDNLGITAAFNRNILLRINRELGADFCSERFWHYAFYDPRQGRVEMHLVSQSQQTVHLTGATISFAQGEPIHTESSYKYSLTELRRLAAQADFEIRHTWTDERSHFAVLYLDRA